MQVTQYIDSVPVSEIQVGDIIVRPWVVHYISSITYNKALGVKDINLKQLGDTTKSLVDQTYSEGTRRNGIVGYVYFNCQKVTVVRYPKEYLLSLNESFRALKRSINAIKVSSETALSEVIEAVQCERVKLPGDTCIRLSGYELARFNQEIDLYKHLKSLIQTKLEYCNLSDLGGPVPANVTAYQLADCILAGDTLDKLRERNNTYADAYAEIERLNQVIRDAWKVTN